MVNTRTDTNIFFNPVFNNESETAQGISFSWVLVLTGNGIEILYYKSQEMYVISEGSSPNDVELRDLVYQSYLRTSEEVAKRNLKVGLNAGFPQFHKIPVNIKDIREVLDTKKPRPDSGQ